MSDSRIIVITDADFLTNSYIDFYSNAQMGINAINWITEPDYKLFVDNKKIDIKTFDLTSREKRQVLVVLVLTPFLILLIGLFVWIKQ